MKTLILYDSQFGNTERIARVIGETLQVFGTAEVIHVAQADPRECEGKDLLIQGVQHRGFDLPPLCNPCLGNFPPTCWLAWRSRALTPAFADTSGSVLLLW